MAPADHIEAAASWLATAAQPTKWYPPPGSEFLSELRIDRLHVNFVQRFFFFLLNWSIETPRSLFDYSFRIFTNANILFSILKSPKTTILKRSLIGCDLKLTSQDMVTWQLYQPISGNGLSISDGFYHGFLPFTGWFFWFSDIHVI